MYKKFGEVWMSGFCDMRADRQADQTHRHADRSTLRPYWGDVIINVTVVLLLRDDEPARSEPSEV